MQALTTPPKTLREQLPALIYILGCLCVLVITYVLTQVYSGEIMRLDDLPTQLKFIRNWGGLLGLLPFALPLLWQEGKRIAKTPTIEYLLIIALLAVSIKIWIANVALALYFLFALYQFFCRPQRPQWNRLNMLDWAMILFSIIGFLGLLWTDNLHMGLSVTIPRIFLLLLPLSLLGYRPKKETLFRIAPIGFYISLAMMTNYLVFYLILAHRYTESIWDFLTLSRSYFTSLPLAPVHYMITQTHPSLPLICFAFLGISTLWGRWNGLNKVSYWEFGVFALIYSLMAQVFHLRYAYGIMMMLFSFPVALWFYNRGKKQLLRGALILVFALETALVYLLGFLHPWLGKIDQLRQDIYQQSCERLPRLLPWGGGSGRDFYRNDEIGNIHSHNSLLNILTDLGWLGVLVLSCLILAMGWQIYKTKNDMLLLMGISLLPIMAVESPWALRDFCIMFSILIFWANQYSPTQNLRSELRIDSARSRCIAVR